MKVPVKWLNDFVKVDDINPKELADKMVLAGFEVEEIIDVGKDMLNVKVGKIVDIKKHENADKLKVCVLDIATEKLQIVTGANNVCVGDVVPVACDGAVLPCGKNITKGQLRGVDSFGMLCGGSELGLTENDFTGAGVDGILQLDKNTPLGTDVRDILGLNDYVLDISVTANRPDCQSVLGIAREVACVLDRKLVMPDTHHKTVSGSIDSEIAIKIDSPLCLRYMGGLVKNVKINDSPQWLKNRLRLVGIKSISNIVDITNYVLTEIGQPMHAFDADCLSGGQIVVKEVSNQKIKALDDKEYVLDDALVIADSHTVVGIAGVMGGQDSEINNQTCKVVFESACFDRVSIRRTSRKLGIRTASSSRFEKGIDTKTQEFALHRCFKLINDLKCGEIVDGVYDYCQNKIDDTIIELNLQKVDAVLGIHVDKTEIIKILENLQIKCKPQTNTVICTVPYFRQDLENQHDLIEEIIRIYGYDKIPSSQLVGSSVTVGGYSQEYKAKLKVQQIMVGLGFNEMLSYSFVAKDFLSKLGAADDNELSKSVSLLNPLSEDIMQMRTTLAYSALKALETNYKRGNSSVKLFECANVYLPKKLPLDTLPDEKPRLAIAAYGDKQDFFVLKGVVETLLGEFGLEAHYKASVLKFMHPTQSADIIVDGTKIGYFGQVHPLTTKNFDFRHPVFFAEICIDKLPCNQNDVAYKQISEYPSISRDLNIVVAESVTVGEMLSCINNCPVSLLESVELLDIYRGSQIAQGNKSITFRLFFRSTDRTLKDTEADNAVTTILSEINRQFGANIRG